MKALRSFVFSLVVASLFFVLLSATALSSGFSENPTERLLAEKRKPAPLLSTEPSKPPEAGQAPESSPSALYPRLREPESVSFDSYTVRLRGLVRKKPIQSALFMLSDSIGARHLGSPGNQRTRDYLISALSSMGYSTQSDTLYRQGFDALDIYTENIVAVLPSARKDADIFLFVSHYDSVSTTFGAIDNASGVSSLLELARVIREAGGNLDAEIRFLFSAAEENLYLGAYAYLDKLSKDELARHKLVLNIDMAGHSLVNPEIPKVLVVSTRATPSVTGPGAPASNPLSNGIEDVYWTLGYPPELLFSPTNIGKHDLVPFFEKGIPTATLSYRELHQKEGSATDFEIIPPLAMHTKEDRFGDTDIDSVTKTTRLVATVFGVLTTPYRDR